MRALSLAATILATLTASAVSAGESGGMPELPVNKWTLLPTKSAPLYWHAMPVYAPSRGQVFFWGRDGASGGGGESGIARNDICAFDAAKGEWVSDVPSASRKELADARNANLGVGFAGRAAMLPGGTPVPSTISCGGTWDSKRNEIVYTVGGLTFAYNPEAKKWRDLKAEKAPRVYGPGAGYDPVNDEIVLFPHFNANNNDLARVNGNVTMHQGTWVYSFKDNTWRRAGDSFGSEEVKKARKALLELIAKVSAATDGAWTLRRTKDAVKPEDVQKGFAEAAAELDRLPMPADAKAVLAKAAAPLKEASDAAAAGKWDEALAAGGRALWVCDETLDKPLRVEPPARCATPLVYDPKNQCLVMFGGHTGLVRLDLQTPENKGGEPGRLNDTWIYDCKTRQWRDASKGTRPPPTLWPGVVYDPVSGLVLLVTRTGNPWNAAAGGKAAIWGFDAAKMEWSKLDEQAWPGPVCGNAWTGWGTVMQEVALDAKAGLLLLLQVRREGNSASQETFALKLDVSKMTPAPAPAWKEPEPIRPQVIPPDDPAVVAKLKALPANKWVHVRPPNDGPTRDWGNAACDPVRGHVYYFGGGHSTYQVNDVAIYAPGVNKWFYAAGDHNDWVPPAGWDGSNPGLRGGRNAGHQRNSYVALDGRMYSGLGAESRRWGAESAKRDYQRYSWFYDVDRGGVWRMVPLEAKKGEGVAGLWGGTHLSSPDGRLFGFGGALEPYDGRFSPGEIYFAAFDAFRNQLSVQKVAPGPNCDPNEDRPFCVLGDKNQVFFYECAMENKAVKKQGTWVYDIKTNAFIDLKPKRQPPADPQTVEYLAGQDAVFAVIRGGAQWVYSFKEKAWAPLPLESDGKLGFATPYAQTVYSAKYGVLVNLGYASGGTAVMRPDVSQMKWE
ncbi:MAG TPA: hypothetical protein PK280_02935 [Planctomycetota bacterium]|nr:hypothetical protein [Planctomycetota bacterium]